MNGLPRGPAGSVGVASPREEGEPGEEEMLGGAARKGLIGEDGGGRVNVIGGGACVEVGIITVSRWSEGRGWAWWMRGE